MTEELSLYEVDQEQQKARLEAMQAIMGEMGWRWFIAEINREIEATDQALRTCTPEELGRIQGRRDAFEQIAYFEDVVDSMLSEDEEDASV